MAVVKMKLVSVIGHMDSLDRVVQVCGDSGVFQPDDAMTFFSDTTGFSAIQEENPYTEPLERLKTAVERTGGRLRLTDMLPDLADEELLAYADAFCGRVSRLTTERGELSARRESICRDIEQLEHFLGLGIDLESIQSCKTIKVRFGRLPKESFEKLQYYNENPYVLFFPGTSDAEYYWGVYFTPLDFADDVDRIFSSLYFERMQIPTVVGTPKAVVDQLRAEQAQVDGRLDEIGRSLDVIWKNEAPACCQIYSRLKERAYYFGIRRHAAQYNDKFILAGWIPHRDERALRTALERVDGIEVSFERPDEDAHHTPPVKLRNPRLFRPFEFFVHMYGLPRYTESDPTAFIALTYIVLFGIMFADLGQGLVLSLIGWLMWKARGMDIGRILIPCGISSAVFGVAFGSVFGFEHLLDPLYRLVFGWEEKPIEVMESDTTVVILLAAVAIGVLLIAVSMVMNIRTCLKQRDYENGLFGANGVAGLVFYLSLIVGVACQLALGIPVLSLPYVLCLIVLPVLLMFFREVLGDLVAGKPDWKPQKWGEFIIQNFFEVFEFMLSYLSNTMSFLRVAAFVLVHAGMMMAVFAIGGMFGTLGFTITAVIGNLLVMAMEAVLVVIQVMRLEYYEMFSRYYIGDGKPFRPLSLRAEEDS